MPTILTIDDEAVVRDTFRRYLETCDWTILEAADGMEGLKVFRRESPDLVLLDLHMPAMSGLEVLEQIAAEAPDVPVVVASGASVVADAVEALRQGAWDYLLKPVTNLKILRHAVERALERAELLIENREYRGELEEKVHLRTAQLEKANQDLARTSLQIIHRLGKAAEFKDNETGRHVVRVSHYSRILAQRLDLDADTVELIFLSSPMHDIGKIGVPDKILLKAGPLDVREWSFMQLHCIIGAELFEPLEEEELERYQEHTRFGQQILGGSDSPLLEMAGRIAANHHEHWDGSGYLHGRTGEEIPLEARIVTVADVYDALSSRRSYKEPLSESVCQAKLRELSGSLLDPRIVEAFFKSIDEILEVKTRWSD